MARDYRIISVIFLFFFSTLITAVPQRGRGARGRYRVNDMEDITTTTTTARVIPYQTPSPNPGNGDTQGNSQGNGQGNGQANAVDTATLIRDPIDQPIPSALLNPIPSNTNPENQPIITSSPTLGTANGKRGLAFNESSPSLAVFSNSDITWVHNWNSAPGDAPSDFLFVPTLWGDESPHTDDWDARASGAQYLMSFNEPDIVAQANMEVGVAVDAYKRLMFPQRARGAKISAPSVSSGSGENEAGIPMGTGWLSQFLSQCNDEDTCVADFVSGHWYGCPDATCSVQNDVASFKDYVEDLIGVADGRDVWVPEFQRYGGAEGQQQFLESVLPWLDGKSEVKRYAYYMVVDGILTTNGAPNELGEAYAAAA